MTVADWFKSGVCVVLGSIVGHALFDAAVWLIHAH